MSSPVARVNVLASVADFVLWYAKDREKVKYRQLYLQKGSWTGTWRMATSSCPTEAGGACRLESGRILPRDPVPFVYYNSTSTGYRNALEVLHIRGSRFLSRETSIGKRRQKVWLALLRRTASRGLVQRSVTFGFCDDFPVAPLNSVWTDTASGGFAEDKIYVVQTSIKVENVACS